MPGGRLAVIPRAAAEVRRRPWDALVFGLALAAVAYTVGYPFVVAHYPPITDLPFHGAHTSILRHYWDPAWHFEEQFTLHPIEVPYVSMYALGALLALVVPIVWATKLMAIAMLLALPAGLAVLAHGMRKTPLWGLLGLGMVWCGLTHWGFLNFMGAIGLYAMTVGFTLLAVDRPSRRHQVGLALSLLAVFFTHIYRFPFALLSVVGTAIIVYPATRRLRPILLPLAPALAVFGAWRLVRKDELAGPLDLGFHPERLREIPTHLFNGFSGRAGAREQALVDEMYGGLVVAAVACAALFVWQGRLRGRTARDVWWGIAVTALPLVLAAGYLFTYLSLPMRIGVWWYVYPREITTAVFVGLAAVPDMPRQWWYRLPLVAALGLVPARMAFHVAVQFHEFDRTTEDFRRIVTRIPWAPKLSYLVFHHGGSSKQTTPYIHLPAWVQAEKGGWLGFHFIGWSASPIRYRHDTAVVPPPTPDRWEWTPERFRVKEHGRWFDTFLVRHYRSPDYLFRQDPSIELVVNEGSWWLYRRVGGAPRGEAP